MKFLILSLLFSISAFSKDKSTVYNGISVSCVDVGKKEFMSVPTYSFCEFKVIKTESRSCTVTNLPGLDNSTSAAIDCKLFDEANLNSK